MLKEMTTEELIKRYKEASKQWSEMGAELKERKLGWKYLFDQGLKVQAIMAYVEEHKVGPVEAKKAIDEYEVNLIVTNVVASGMNLDEFLKPI